MTAPSLPAAAIEDPPARWWQMVVLSVGLLLAEAPWFASGAVAPLLRTEWSTTGLDLPLLTVAVQVGFAVGALGLAAVGAADVLPGTRLFVIGCVVAAAANLGFAALADGRGLGPAVPLPDRPRDRRGLPDRGQAHRGLVPARPRPGRRRAGRRADPRLGAAVPVPGGRGVRRPGLARRPSRSPAWPPSAGRCWSACGAGRDRSTCRPSGSRRRSRWRRSASRPSASPTSATSATCGSCSRCGRGSRCSCWPRSRPRAWTTSRWRAWRPSSSWPWVASAASSPAPSPTGSGGPR